MATEEIREHFINSLRHFATSASQIQVLWSEAEAHYSSPDRQYHTLAHLNHLISELVPLRNHFANWDTVVLATAYHDIVYNIHHKDNEEQSARFAGSRLEGISFPSEQIEHCKKMILATRTHEQDKDEEINLFTDADLSILGTQDQTYREYSEQIRGEYSSYTDLEFQNGRKRVLQHFLNMNRIFKTNYFFDAYEQSARINLKLELASLNQRSAK